MINSPSSPSTRLLIGYWHEYPNEGGVRLPHPQPLVDPNWNVSLRPDLVAYLKNGTAYQVSRGFSYCRFGCTQRFLRATIPGRGGRPIVIPDDTPDEAIDERWWQEGSMSNGRADMCDDVWCWPEGLAHYVEVHHIRLPDDFVAHARSRNFEPAPRSGGRIDQDSSFWLKWAALNAPFRFEPHCDACREARAHRAAVGYSREIVTPDEDS